MFNSTVARAHVSAAGAKGGQDDQALGRSRGGFSTKIHLKVDLDGLPLAFHLTGGEASDSRNFELLLDIGPDILPRAAITDKGYDAKSNRDSARKRGICPVIPHRAIATDRPAFFPKILYKARARIEQPSANSSASSASPFVAEDCAQYVLRRARPRPHLIKPSTRRFRNCSESPVFRETSISLNPRGL